MNLKITAKRFLTILDLGHEPYRDQPWQPRGNRVFNGFRQRQMQGFRT